MSLYIDGAHTVESLENCATWFKEEACKEKINYECIRENAQDKRFHRVLLFNLTGECRLQRQSFQKESRGGVCFICWFRNSFYDILAYTLFPISYLWPNVGDRDPAPLLEQLIDTNFDFAIFCPNATTTASLTGNSADQTKKASDDSSSRKTCLTNLRAWREMQR